MFRASPAYKQRGPDQKHLRTTRPGAFTLIELLVVVLIIGILSAIALPQYQKAVLHVKFVQLGVYNDTIVNFEKNFNSGAQPCFSLKRQNYMADDLCALEMDTKTWYNGCSSVGCHCYRKQ